MNRRAASVVSGAAALITQPGAPNSLANCRYALRARKPIPKAAINSLARAGVMSHDIGGSFPRRIRQAGIRIGRDHIASTVNTLVLAYSAAALPLLLIYSQSGLGLGDNAVAALVTRALSEMTRLGVALGGRAETFSGLSGVGDLIATCFSVHSRNHRVGFALGSGKTLEEAVNSLGMVAEGVPNTLSIHDAARKAGVRTPILDGVFSVLYGGNSASAAMRELLDRDPRPENS